MAYNGSGLFARLFSWQNDAANSINIRADRMDAEFDGIASGLSNCITRDGQGKPSGAMDWNGQNLNNVNALAASSVTATGAVAAATGAFSAGVTAATPATGNRSTSVATTQMFANEFGASLGSSGWQKLPSGLILQWGQFNQADNAGAATGYNISFPIAFPTAALQASISVGNNMNGGGCMGSVEGLTPINLAGFTYSSNTISRIYRWIAIGY